MAKLTPKRKRFCEEYPVDCNATKAAERAGFSLKTAYSQGQRLLKNVEVQAYIAELMEKRSLKTGVTTEWVVNKLRELVDICMSARPVLIRVGGELTESGEYKIDSYGAKGGLELLGKHLGMFKENEKPPAEVNLYQQFIGGTNGDLADESKLKGQIDILYPDNGRGANRN